MRVVLTITSVIALMLSGCGDLSPPSRPPLAPPGIAIPTPDKPAPPPAPPGVQPAPAATPLTPAPAGQPQSPPAPAPGTERTQAAVGMGQKGHYAPGLITTPLDAIWRTREKVTLDNIKHAVDLYKAGTPDGRGPATHEEFMEKIIKANQIRLPDLPPGQRYVYDPKQEQLMVERPAPAP